MIKIVKDFLPKPLFKQLLSVVESQNVDWHWQTQSIHYGPTGSGDNKWMFTKTIKDRQIVSKELMPLFSVFKDFQDEHYKGDTILKMKLNLNPNQGTPIEFGLHTDTIPPESDIITSVFNFHTSNGYTCIGKEKVPSVANQIVIFNQQEHYGVTQSDIPRRIVLNTNIRNDR